MEINYVNLKINNVAENFLILKLRLLSMKESPNTIKGKTDKIDYIKMRKLLYNETLYKQVINLAKYACVPHKHQVNNNSS